MPAYIALTVDMEEPGGEDTVEIRALDAKSMRDAKRKIGAPLSDDADEGFLAYSIWPAAKLIAHLQSEVQRAMEVPEAQPSGTKTEAE